jgi:hypothetical protein
MCGCFMVCVFLCDPVRIVCYGVCCVPVCIGHYGCVKKFWLFRVFRVCACYLQCYANTMRLLACFVLITHIQADTSANAIHTQN